MKNTFYSLFMAMLTAVLSTVIATPAAAQNDDLQEFINQAAERPTTRGSDGYTIVDLSKFSATTRTTTLEVNNGNKFQFVNGELKRGDGLTGPIMKIMGNSSVKISSSDGTYKTNAVFRSNSVDYTAVEIAGGTLYVENHGYLDAGTNSTTRTSGTAVNITSSGCHFYLNENGMVTGTVKNTSSSSFIELNGGMGHTGGADWLTVVDNASYVVSVGSVWLHVSLLGSANVLKLKSAPKYKNLIVVPNTAKAGREVVEPAPAMANPYYITAADMDKFIVVNEKGDTLPTVLKDGAIYIGETDDLQEFINNTPTNATSYTDVDLTKFSATQRKKTLTVTAGRKIRFTGGKLTRATDLGDGYIMTISGNASVVVDGVEDYSNSGNVISLAQGKLDIKGGSTISGDNTVVMTGGQNELYLRKSATCLGNIRNETEAGSNDLMYFEDDANRNGHVYTYSDVFCGGHVETMFHLLGKSNVVRLLSKYSSTNKDFPNFSLYASNRVYNDSIVSGTTRQTLNDGTVIGGYLLEKTDLGIVKFVGKYSGMATYYQHNNATNLICVNYDDLQAFLDGLGDDGPAEGTGTASDPFTARVPCSGTEVTDDVTFNGDDLQYYLLTGHMPGDDTTTETDCQPTVNQVNGNVTIGTGSTVNITDVSWHGCGCSDHIYVYGTLIIDEYVHIINYIRFIHVMPGGHVIFRGGSGSTTGEVIYMEGGTVEWHGGSVTGGTYGWYNAGGTISIYGGTISGGTAGGYTGTGGTTHIYGGTITGGLDNYGTTYIHGGAYIEGGSILGTIRNGGTIYLNGGGGNFVLDDIYLLKGCHFYITSTLTIDLRIHVTVDNIVLGEPIVCGGDGYTLTEADCSHITINLPTGYAWRYDPTCHGIVIYSTTGISGVNADTPTVKARYNLLGRRVNDSYKGVVIEQMSNGKRRKAVKK